MSRTAFSNDAGVADAIMSTGLRVLASAGRNARSAATVESSSVGTTMPRYSHASDARMPGPPAFVTMPTRLPRGTGWFAISIATSNSSSIVSVRITPACAHIALTAESAPASEPVCDEAARMPAPVRPLFTAAIGFLRPTRRAISRKRRGFPNDSRYSSTTSVPGSCSQYSSRSLPDTSALLPTLMKCEMPMPSARAVSRIASPSAPLCDENATRPGGGYGGANVPSMRTPSSVLSTPRQLGPTSRMP